MCSLASSHTLGTQFFICGQKLVLYFVFYVFGFALVLSVWDFPIISNNLSLITWLLYSTTANVFDLGQLFVFCELSCRMYRECSPGFFVVGGENLSHYLPPIWLDVSHTCRMVLEEVCFDVCQNERDLGNYL